MATTFRCLTILAAIVLAALLFTCTLHAAVGPQSTADLTPSATAPPRINTSLLMAQRNMLSHQFPGGLPVQDRARRAGSTIPSGVNQPRPTHSLC